MALITAAQFASKHKVSRQTIYLLIKANKIKFSKVGRYHFVNENTKYKAIYKKVK